MEKNVRRMKDCFSYSFSINIVFLLTIAIIGVSACIEDIANVKVSGKCKSIKSPQKLQTKLQDDDPNESLVSNF